MQAAMRDSIAKSHSGYVVYSMNSIYYLLRLFLILSIACLMKIRLRADGTFFSISCCCNTPLFYFMASGFLIYSSSSALLPYSF